MRCWLYHPDGPAESIQLEAPVDSLERNGRRYKRWESRNFPDLGNGRANVYLYAEGDDMPPMTAFVAVQEEETRRRRAGSGGE